MNLKKLATLLSCCAFLMLCKNVATYDEWVKSHLEKHEKDIYFFRDVFPLSKRIDPHLEVFEDQLNALADAAWNNPENSFIVFSKEDSVKHEKIPIKFLASGLLLSSSIDDGIGWVSVLAFLILLIIISFSSVNLNMLS